MVNTTDGALTSAGILSTLILMVFGVLTIWASARAVRTVNILPAAITAVATSSTLLMVQLALDNLLVKDELIWHARAQQVSSYLLGETQMVSDFGGKDGYVWIIGGIYAAIGPIPLIPILINILLHGLTVCVVARTTEIITLSFGEMDSEWRKKSVRTSAFLIALAPSIIFFVPNVLRETLSGFLIAFATLMCIQLVRLRKVAYLPLTAVPLLLLFWVRDAIGLGVLMALFIASAFIWARSSKYQPVIRVFIFIPLAIVAGVFWTYASDRLGLSTEALGLYNEALAKGANSGFIEAGSLSRNSSYWGLITTNVPRVLFGPFIWEFRPVGVLVLAFMEGTIWIICLILALFTHPFRMLKTSDKTEVKSADDGRIVLIIIIVALALLAMISLSGGGNYGIISRFRIMPLVVIAPLSAIGLSLVRRRFSQPATPRPGVSTDFSR